MMTQTPRPSAPLNAYGYCAGSYQVNAYVSGTVKHGHRVTAECAHCHRRISLVTLHALPLKPRGLGQHRTTR